MRNVCIQIVNIFNSNKNNKKVYPPAVIYSLITFITEAGFLNVNKSFYTVIFFYFHVPTTLF